MPSVALQTWLSTSADALDQIESAHASVGGRGRGRRVATQQINHAYAVLVASHFQRFCRDLHSAAVDHIASVIEPVALRQVLRESMLRDRRLDRQNAQPASLGADFGNLGMRLWPTVHAMGRANKARHDHLEELNSWRNAIAHQDFEPVGGELLWLKKVRAWRVACDALAGQFDAAVSKHLIGLVGSSPW